MGFLRFLLSLSVISNHTQLPIPIFKGIPFRGHGEIAIFSFFIISAFYMRLILDKKYFAYNRGVLFFYLNRIFRIYPLYILIILLSFILMQFYGDTSIAFWTQSTEKFWSNFNGMTVFEKLYIIIPNIFIIFTHVLIHCFGYSSTEGWVTLGSLNSIHGQYFLLFPPGWTLSIEMFFYFLIPFFRTPGSYAIFLILINFLVMVANHFNQALALFISQCLPSVFFMYFLFGIFSYEIYKKLININKDNKNSIWIGRFLLSMFTIGTVFANYIDIRIAYNFYPIFICLSIPFIFMAFQQSRIDQFFGYLSYPLYMSHFLIYKFICNNTTINPVNYYIGLFLFCVFLVYYFEIPLENYRKKFTVRLKASSISILAN